MHGSLEAIDYADQNGIGEQGALEKYRVQVPVILLATILLQYGYAFVNLGFSTLPANINNSILITLLANVVGLLSYRRMRLYPGTRRLAFILPSFALAWAGAAVLLIFFRVPYSIIQVSIGFSGAIATALALNAWNRRPSAAPFLVIPSMRVNAILSEMPELRHIVCERVEDIDAANTVIVADLHADLPAEWEQALAKAALRGVSIYHVKQIGESLTGRVQVDHLSENALGSLEPNSSYAIAKILVERALSALVLLASLPILLVACLAIRLDSPGPALFKQTRIGFRGEKFTILKLRTMADKKGPRSREDDITLQDDPRITKLGRFLRASRIDELPQLVNVVLGDMSLIGPRPETERLSQWYAQSIDFYAYRHVVLPGITGWAQVNQGHVASQEEVLRKLQYDFYYIKNFSLWLDIVIALKTVKVMILKLGAK